MLCSSGIRPKLVISLIAKELLKVYSKEQARRTNEHKERPKATATTNTHRSIHRRFFEEGRRLQSVRAPDTMSTILPLMMA